MKKHKIQTYVDDYTKRAISAIADGQERSESFVVGRILKKYLQQNTIGGENVRPDNHPDEN